MKTLTAFFLLLTAPALALAATIEVPGDYPTIQDAVTAAAAGDTVLVHPGTYMENVVVLKELHLISALGPEITVIDGQQLSSVVYFYNVPGTSTVLEGFTLTNGIGVSSSSTRIGGGVRIQKCSPTIRSNIIASNISSKPAYGGGGGISVQEGSPVIENNVIHNNTGWFQGGGIYSWGSYPVITNNLIYGNSAENGGGLYLGTQHSVLTNNTIWGNSATLWGGGLYCKQYVFDVKNCIIRANTAGSGGEQIYDPGSPTLTVMYSNVMGGWPGTGNISGSAQFYNAGARDFHLKQDPCQPGVVNPCVDGGDPSTPMFDGATRTDNVQDSGVVDMGYHYRAVKTHHVPADYATIQQAIDAAYHGDTVVVAPGSYTENITFSGKAITVRSSLGAHQTVIDGNQAGSGVAFVNGEGLDSVLEGFTITNGSGTYDPVDQRYLGGGIVIVNGSPTIRDNVISDNTVQMGDNAGSGGGVYWGHSGSPSISNNIISNNNIAHLNGMGGGIALMSAQTSYGKPKVENNIITNNSALAGGGILCQAYVMSEISDNYIASNSATYFGGGVFLNGSTDDWLVDNVVCHNSSEGSGGGIASYGGADQVFENNLIYSNSAISSSTNTYGGGISLEKHNNVEIINCTVTDNTADQGGGIYIDTNSPNDAKILNSIIWDNNAPTKPEIEHTTSVDIKYSDIKGGWPGTGNIDADPLFFNAATDNYRLMQDPCQPGTTNPCVDAGYAYSLVIEGSTRTDAVQDSGIVDMGYHYDMPLKADAETVPITGGTVNLYLKAGGHNQLRNYIILGSVTGTSPGFPLPGGYVTIPINWDPFTDLMFNLLNSPVFKNFLGLLDAEGNAEAQLNSPALPPNGLGLVMYYAYTMNNPFNFVSNAIVVEVVP